MIVTPTPNPSLDRTLEIDDLAHGTVIRGNASRVEDGGKGVRRDTEETAEQSSQQMEVAVSA